MLCFFWQFYFPDVRKTRKMKSSENGCIKINLLINWKFPERGMNFQMEKSVSYWLQTSNINSPFSIKTSNKCQQKTILARTQKYFGTAAELSSVTETLCSSNRKNISGKGKTTKHNASVTLISNSPTSSLIKK